MILKIDVYPDNPLYCEPAAADEEVCFMHCTNGFVCTRKINHLGWHAAHDEFTAEATQWCAWDSVDSTS